VARGGRAGAAELPQAEGRCRPALPKFPDCAPGETKKLRGWLSFYKGTEVEAEFKRIEKTGWRTGE
jgi:hypothetical protein